MGIKNKAYKGLDFTVYPITEKNIVKKLKMTFGTLELTINSSLGKSSPVTGLSYM